MCSLPNRNGSFKDRFRRKEEYYKLIEQSGKRSNFRKKRKECCEILPEWRRCRPPPKPFCPRGEFASRWPWQSCARSSLCPSRASFASCPLQRRRRWRLCTQPKAWSLSLSLLVLDLGFKGLGFKSAKNMKRMKYLDETFRRSIHPLRRLGALKP